MISTLISVLAQSWQKHISGFWIWLVFHLHGSQNCNFTGCIVTGTLLHFFLKQDHWICSYMALFLNSQVILDQIVNLFSLFLYSNILNPFGIRWLCKFGSADLIIFQPAKHLPSSIFLKSHHINTTIKQMYTGQLIVQSISV